MGAVRVVSRPCADLQRETNMKSRADLLYEVCMGAPLIALADDIHDVGARWEQRAAEYERIRLRKANPDELVFIEDVEGSEPFERELKLCIMLRDTLVKLEFCKYAERNPLKYPRACK